MSDVMSFPATVEEFMESYKIVDREEVYTNGAELIPIFRMKQWFEHEASTAQPKHGKWLPDNRCGGGYWVCSSCKYPTEAFAADVIYKYCPFCGADMRTKETDCDYERAVEQLEHDMLYEPTFNPDDGSM